MKRLLLFLLPTILLLGGCASKLDDHYFNQFKYTYLQWFAMPYEPTRESWLTNNMQRIENNMRQDKYNGAVIHSIRTKAYEKALEIQRS